MSHFVILVTKKSHHMSWHMMLQYLIGVMGKEYTDQLKVV